MNAHKTAKAFVADQSSANKGWQNDKERFSGLSERLRKRVLGQDKAIDAVVRALLVSSVGFHKQTRPRGSFLFLGPTGVGKTELAKALAEEHFDGEKSLVRIDMSEYMDEQSMLRLIGASPEYIRLGKGGQLTEPVKQRPRSVVLLDEVDKAHRSVFNILRRVLEDGTLTDFQSGIVDFKNTVICMTSNLGTRELLSAIEGKYSMQAARDDVMQEVRKHFRHDVLDEIDEVLIFEELSHDEDRRKLVSIKMRDVARRAAEKGIALHVTDAAIDFILSKSYVPIYGARSISRWVEKEVVTEVAIMSLGERPKKNSSLRIDIGDGEKGMELKYHVT